jgi:hypothetical protein
MEDGLNWLQIVSIGRLNSSMPAGDLLIANCFVSAMLTILWAFLIIEVFLYVLLRRYCWLYLDTNKQEAICFSIYNKYQSLLNA